VDSAPYAEDVTDSICSNTALTHDLTSDVSLSGTSFSWEVAAPTTVSGAVSGTGDEITDVLENTSGASEDVVYTITATSPSGCDYTYDYTVTVNPSSEFPIITDNYYYACNDNSGVALVDARDAFTETQLEGITWYNAATGGQLITLPILQQEGKLSYFAEYLDPDPAIVCPATERVEITLEFFSYIEAPVLDTASVSTCYDSGEDALYTITNYPTDSNTTVYWYEEGNVTPLAEGASFSPDTSIYSQEGTTYSFYVQFVSEHQLINGAVLDCESPIVSFNYSLNPSPEVIIQSNGLPYVEIASDVYQLFAEGGTVSADQDYIFSVFDSDNNVPVVVSSDNTFTVTTSSYYDIFVEDANGCIGEYFDVWIEKKEFLIPNVFSPSNDSSVPTWYPGRDTVTDAVLLDYQNMEVFIFDRYGRLISQFLGSDIQTSSDGWDGTYDGMSLPTGDYWYHIKTNHIDNKEYTGHFTLYRKN